jgi:hypothetical protein
VANRNDRQRNDKRAKKSDEPTLDLFVRPAEGCEDLVIPVDMPDARYRITQRLMSYRHQLVEFAVVLSKWNGDGWDEIYSIDTCHGYLHEHIHGHRKPGDRRDIRPLVSQLDVQESLDPAYDQVRDHYLRLTG